MADRSIKGNLSRSRIGACGSWSSTTCPLGLGDSALTPDRATTTRHRTTPLLEYLVRGWARLTGAPTPLPSVHPYALTCGVRVLTVFPSPPLNSRGWSGQLLGRRYRRTASGANTAMIAADQARAAAPGRDGPPGGRAPWPRISPRSALVATVTGWLAANACSQPGMVWTGTNTELVNASGNTPM